MFGAKLKGKKVLMLIAHQKFRDEELLHTKEVLVKKGASVTVASTNLTPARGMLGATYKPDVLLGKVDASQYDAVVFVGGSGAEVYFNDPNALELARTAYSGGKVVAALCIAPSILALSGILKGRKATVWNGAKYIGILRDNGAIYTAEPVTVDGRIITANGPQSARKFGQAIAKALGA